MKVLFAAWEVAPFFKVGGLGDIARSLSIAIHRLGVDVRVIIPYYKTFNLLGQTKKEIAEFYLDFDGKIKIKIFQIKFEKENIPIYLLENEKYFNHVDEKTTWVVFNLAITTLLKYKLLNWEPDVIQCHDLHAGLTPLLVKENNLPIKTLFTIHNLAHQGETTYTIIKNLGIDQEKFHLDKEKHVILLLEAIIYADLINTVSPNYSREILTKEYGQGFEKILKSYKYKLCGILNGIDYDIRNSANDKYLPYHYQVNNFVQGKANNKQFLQKKLGFKIDLQMPLFGFIGRFSASQKGVKIIYEMLNKIDLSQYQFVFLGKGNIQWELKYLLLSKRYPKNIYLENKFDEQLASLIYAGSDFILIPSRFEPCGLIQMMAMRYGTLPIATPVGGLKDTIDDGKDGFLMDNYSETALEKTLKQAVKLRQNQPEKFKKMIETAIRKDFSWTQSAKKYLNLYNKLINQCKQLKTS